MEEEKKQVLKLVGKVGLWKHLHMKTSLLTRRKRHFPRMTRILVGRTVCSSH